MGVMAAAFFTCSTANGGTGSAFSPAFTEFELLLCTRVILPSSAGSMPLTSAGLSTPMGAMAAAFFACATIDGAGSASTLASMDFELFPSTSSPPVARTDASILFFRTESLILCLCFFPVRCDRIMISDGALALQQGQTRKPSTRCIGWHTLSTCMVLLLLVFLCPGEESYKFKS
ncbi:hypothetical protein SEVIR_8G249835v4 [Setaria viridis]